MVCSEMVCTELLNAPTVQSLTISAPCSRTDVLDVDTDSNVPLIWPRFPKVATSQLTIFCDLDGPIIDVSERYYQTYLRALQLTLEAQPALPLSKEDFWQLKQERTADPEIARRSGISESAIPNFLNSVTTLVNQPQQLCQDQLQPGVNWALALLKDAGVRLVLVTLRPQAEAEQLLVHYHLRDYFDEVWGTTDPNAAYLNNSEQKLSLLAAAVQSRCEWQPNAEPLPNAWMIGDTEADVLAGQSLNVQTIALTCGIRSQNFLAQLNPSRIDRDLVVAVHYLLGVSARVSQQS
jgi:phosphoglycolate phosphatase